MKKLYFLSTLMLLMAVMLPQNVKAQVSVWDGTYAPWTNGTGTEADPFLIENAQQLAYLAYRVNNGLDAVAGHVSNHDLHYKLMTDVYLNGSENFQWTPIGYYISGTNYYSFGGHFDGNNHAISGLHINSSDDRVGFFGYTNGAEITNLEVSGDSVVTTGRFAGGIVGYAQSSSVINCNNNCNISSYFTLNNSSYSGGIIGYSSSITITNCYNTGNVYSTSTYIPYSGGIIGCMDGLSTISNCYNIGDVSSSSVYNNSYSGGITAFVVSTTINNCYNTGDVSASSADFHSISSGIVGLVASSYCSLTINNSYNSGEVISTYCAGGILGENNGSTVITNSYNVGNVIRGNNMGGGIVDWGASTVINCFYLNTSAGNNTYGGSPLTENVMKSVEFVGMLNNGSCAWEQDLAPFVNSGYPVLTMIQLSAYTLAAASVSQTHSMFNGIVSVNNDVLLSSGFMYKPTTSANYYYVSCNSTSDSIAYYVSGLIPSTTYTYKTYLVTAGCDTTFGNDITFTTLGVSVTTNPATSLTESSVTLNGSMNMGDATVTNKGFEYRAVGDNTYTTINATSGTDIFSASLYGLPVNTDYEYRAFVNIAENTETYYGTTRTFEVSWLNADTILIYDADMLQWVSDRCNTGTTFEGKYIKLMNNIVLPLNQPNNMTSIGVYPSYPFKGTFDGNGMLISNLYIDHPNTEYQGFFGYTLNANLYEVGLVNITASGRNYTGGMVAYAANTYMRDCYVNGGSLFALSYCGGLVGYQSEGTNSIISGCYNTCTVSGTSYVGGLVGFSNYATVRNSYVAASVAAQGSAVGAIIGGANEVLMYNCYFSTSITGQSDAIGEHNFRDGEGLSNEEMQSTQFVATLNQGLVRPVWKSDYAVPINNGFPILIWQYSDVETCDAPTNPNAVLNGTSATLSWSGGDNASYYVVEYGVLGGETHSENTSSHQLTLHNLQSTNYFWRVKSVCSFGESNFVNGNNITVGIDDYNGFNFKVYPNPTSNIVNVECEMGNGVSGDVTIQLYDIYGKLVGVNVVGANDSSPLQRATAQIDLSRYANGVYFIKLVSGSGQYMATRKIVKR